MPDPVKDRIKGMPLLHLILLLSVSYLAISLLFIFFISSSIKQKAIEDLSREDARQTAELIFQSLYSVMSDGWNKKEIMETIQRLNKAAPKMEITAYRGEPVIREYGDIPGEAEKRQADPLIQTALSEGKELLKTSDSALRFIYPVIVSDECLRCHEEAQTGDINGVIDIRYPIENLKISLTLIINVMIGYFVLVMAILFTGLFIKLKAFVVKPIIGLARIMGEITHNADLSKRVSHGGWIREVHHLTDYFNRMLGTLQDFQYRLEELSVRDPLTNLYNRRKFELFLEYEVDRATRHDRQFCLIMIDLDNFKHINDTLGHVAGDQILKDVSSRLTGSVRNTDTVARLGGDEFLLIIPELADNATAKMLASTILALFEKPFVIAKQEFFISTSIGMAIYPQDGDTPDELLRSADMALYRVKDEGRNGFSFYDLSMNEALQRSLLLNHHLHSAISNNEIEIYYQPIINLKTRKIIAAEALMRWHHSQLGFISPEEFIPLAEKNGLIHQLGEFALLQACTQAAEWQAIYPMQIAVNFSSVQFRYCSELLHKIETVLATTGLPAEKLQAEVTESLLIDNHKELADMLKHLTELGIQLSIDDFGTGYSALAYLQKFSFSKLKIDRAFVSHLETNPADLALVRAILAMAKALNLE
ncbi:MAG: EAL domain-containing protein, partial [Sedimenticola sp.]|nr:EAL domain-containing protein [Sedimenticola sp.]